MADADQVLTDFPPTRSFQVRNALRDGVLGLTRLGATDVDVAAIETLRRDLLGVRVPRSSDTIRVRVWFSVLCDLVSQGWAVRVEGDSVVMRAPEGCGNDSMAEKARVRNGHLIERDRYLREEPVRRFVREMETSRLYNGQWKSIFSLMRDGESLAVQLTTATQDRLCHLEKVIAPYVQVADSNSTCEFTGLRLIDIWRYFRLTWSTVPQTVPGRRMLVLIRDAAAPDHPIIGVAALGSPVVQLAVRDGWIRWSAAEFLKELQECPSAEHAAWTLSGIDEAIDDVYRYDLARRGLISAKQIARPTREVIAKLRNEARRARVAHNRYARTGRHKKASTAPEATDWRQQAKTFLFRSKRCLALATALEARMVLNELGLKTPSKSGLATVLAHSQGRRAIASVLRYMKAKHVGIDMADITVCGAIPPYTHVLGGKLVSVLMASPEIITAYRVRYAKSPSLIASGIKGELVQRRPNLVLLGTTSLYGVASSQYNRLVVPAAALEGALADVRFYELGKTSGFGSYHFSKATTDEMNELAQQRRGGRRVNNIFGEGVNPKLRRVREALATVGLPSDRLLRHGSPRLVYGVPLATNFREVLTGVSHKPQYLLRFMTDRDGTNAIAQYWRKRWLAGRIERADVIDAVRGHSVLRPVRHGARVPIDETAELPLFGPQEATSCA